AMHGAPLYIAETCPSLIALSLFLLSAYYNVLGGLHIVALAGLLLYVGSYQLLWEKRRKNDIVFSLNKSNANVDSLTYFYPLNYLSDIIWANQLAYGIRDIPLRTRGRGISLAVLTNFGSNVIVTFAFSPLKEFLGAENLFLLFAAIALLSLLFVFFVVPKTKGLK
ncbi:D-xylose-proton symporter-like 3, chloroplastic, partial [Morella rubra]